MDASILNLHDQIQAKPKSWITIEILASAQATRGRLTGGLADYANADASVASAFALAPLGSGPWLTRAHIDFSLHRFALALDALDAAEQRVIIDDPMRASIHGLRGELSLQAGDLDLASELADMAEALDPTPTTAARSAQIRWRRGDYAGAEALYLEGLSRYHGLDPSVRAWFHLQLGIMELERADHDAALVHFMDANAELSGYYLVEEHIAEVWALQGRHAESLGLYLDIIDRTGNPEFMDAVAGLHIAAGDPAEANPWIEAATQAYEAQLAAHPELAYGHALGHYIEFGPSARAVEIAQANLALRPNGDARAELIRAYLADHRNADALAEAQTLDTDAWRTANTLSAIHEAYAASDQLDAPVAVAAREQLCAMAPLQCPE
ncbi:hypothetical protein DB30_04032 [Enhygromyxa salina]|uniref:Tetratricopeptide repeat protein n=1 Tax=Enhygromyxa salina TaxID=215803 RepID=A0A0C2D588_9BACT|nr:hypothetical protein [Enhygromyxa salina]KIG16870.1 hypothetical protein DB30_04032 [Enhygromyxa salina]